MSKLKGIWEKIWYRKYIFLVVIISIALLSAVYALTRRHVQSYEKSSRELVCEQVMKNASAFSVISYTNELSNIVYAGYDDNFTLVGYCIETTVHSFAGDLTVMVGVDEDAQVTGVYIESSQDDPDYIEQASADEYLAQYVGKSGTVHYDAIDGVSGATVTSRTLTDGVNQALKVASQVTMKAGGDDLEDGQE